MSDPVASASLVASLRATVVRTVVMSSVSRTSSAPPVHLLRTSSAPPPHLLLCLCTLCGSAGTALGSFQVNYDFVLQSAAGRAGDSGITSTSALSNNAAAAGAAAAAVYDINGLWSDGHGGLISAEARGSTVVFTEVPHPRTWGRATGHIVGNTVRAVDFKAPHSTNGNAGGAGVPRVGVWAAAGLSTGTIGPSDPFNSAYAGSTSPGSDTGAAQSRPFPSLSFPLAPAPCALRHTPYASVPLCLPLLLASLALCPLFRPLSNPYSPLPPLSIYTNFILPHHLTLHPSCINPPYTPPLHPLLSDPFEPFSGGFTTLDMSISWTGAAEVRLWPAWKCPRYPPSAHIQARQTRLTAVRGRRCAFARLQAHQPPTHPPTSLPTHPPTHAPTHPLPRCPPFPPTHPWAPRGGCTLTPCGPKCNPQRGGAPPGRATAT